MKIVTCAIWIQDHRVFSARRAPGQKNAGLWEFPGGKTEPGESDAQGLEREMYEEFGVRGTAGAFLTESRYTYAPDADILLRAFLFTSEDNPCPTVHDRVAWVTKEELLSLPLSAADVPIASAAAELL